MKTDSLCEFFSSGALREKIDRAAGIIRDVKILGLASRNNRVYPESTLADAAPLYENAKVNLNHPDGSPLDARKYQDRFGLIKNVRLLPGEGLFGDFHFNPKHALAEQFLWDAENSPENVGFSHNVEAVVARKDGRQLVEKIESVRSVDLVADPATTCGLFEQTAPPSEKVENMTINIDAKTNHGEFALNENDRISADEIATGSISMNAVESAVTATTGDATESLESRPRRLESLRSRLAVLEQILEKTLAEPSSPLNSADRQFAALLLETENPELAEKFLAERIEFRRRLNIDPLGAGPIRSVAPESLAQSDVSTEEFVRRIAR